MGERRSVNVFALAKSSLWDRYNPGRMREIKVLMKWRWNGGATQGHPTIVPGNYFPGSVIERRAQGYTFMARAFNQ